MKETSSVDANFSPTSSEGTYAESIVADELVRAGFLIVAKNFRLGHKEADLIALEGDTLCIIEVKGRSKAALLKHPDVLINRDKRREMMAIGTYFFKSHKAMGFRNLRFDFALVLMPKFGEEPQIKYYRNAFLPAVNGTF